MEPSSFCKSFFFLFYVLFSSSCKYLSCFGLQGLGPKGGGTVMIRDTRLGNQSCDWSGDLSPTFSEFVYVCLLMFGHLTFSGKLYIVPMLRDLLPLASISTSIPSY